MSLSDLYPIATVVVRCSRAATSQSPCRHVGTNWLFVECNGDYHQRTTTKLVSFFAAIPVMSKLFKLVHSQSTDRIYGCRTTCGNDSSNECRQCQRHDCGRHHLEVCAGDLIKLGLHKSHAEQRDRDS